MVIFVAWHRTALDPKSISGLPMTGEDTGLGALASPLAGYLEKVQARAASLEYCPWCTAKGLRYALRSYRINLQESMTLCTNPQCLFPLVTRSLEDVLASLDPAVGINRKTTLPLEEDEKLLKPPNKRMRLSDFDDHESLSLTAVPVDPGEHEAADVQHAAPQTDCGKVDGSQRERLFSDTTGRDSPHHRDAVSKKDLSNRAPTDGSAPPPHLCLNSPQSSQAVDEVEAGSSPQRSGLCSPDSDVQQEQNPEVLDRCDRLDSSQPLFTVRGVYSNNSSPSLTQHEEPLTPVDVSTGEDSRTQNSEIDDLSRTSLMASEKLVSVPKQLFWKTDDSLCWLDSLLVALVNCKSLRKCKPLDEPQQSLVWRLMKGHEDICAAVQVHHQTGRDGVVRVPNHVLQKANSDAQALRTSAFRALQSKLRCKLGQRETPVSAMPLLLSMDSWAERLFKSTFHWEFTCSACRAASTEWVNKTLSTCTNLLPGWHPLHATHTALCSVCRKKNQRRTMTLVCVPPVFALHFVEGLPDGDVGAYSFDFEGKHYAVSTVIQFDPQLKHFVTWTRSADGSWLEYDSFKHPDCKAHKVLRVPAQELHIVFWEEEEERRKEGGESRACSPSTTFTESSPPQSGKVPRSADTDSGAEEPAAGAPGHSLAAPRDNADIVGAPSVLDGSVPTDASIATDTLLGTLEGLAHDEIVTLTSVEVNGEADTRPSENGTPSPDGSVTGRSEAITSTSDSSAIDVPVGPGSESESGDPTYVPRVRGRGKPAATCSQTARVGGAPKAAAGRSAAPSRPPPLTSVAPVDLASQNTATRVENSQQASAVSSTNTFPPPGGQKPLLFAEPNTHWSYLLRKQPQNPFQKSNAHLAPTAVTQPRPAAPVHPARRAGRTPPAPAAPLHPKVPLQLEEASGHPLKAAEMFGGFGAKSLNTQTAPKPPPPVTSNQLAALAVTSGTSLQPLETKRQLENSAKKQSSVLCPGLGSTDALRYKLLKKLKAKKKKLLKLNKLLGVEGGASLQPDSTDLCSPSTVSSSTYDGSTYDDILSDLLSPATTASSFSPDSTEFLEMLANGKDGAQQTGRAAPEPQTACGANNPDTENFLEEFLSQAEAVRPTDLEAEALSALELFL